MGVVYPSSDQLRARRAASVWTRIHPVFALGQLLAFVVSVGLLFAYLGGGVSLATVHQSVLIKIALMVGAIVTGALWERDMYGQYWFAPEFMGEDTMTLNVFILHVGYLAVAWAHPEQVIVQLGTLVIAYGVYIANVAQYVLRTHANSKASAVRVPAP